MIATAPHALRGERTPPAVAVALLVLATGAAAAGASRLPRPATQRANAPAPVAATTVPPVTPVAPPAPAAVAPSVAPAPTVDPRCPPRWSVRFAHGAWTAPPGLPARFARLRAFLAERRGASVLVLGFADPEGSDRDNQVLSLRRATGVARALRRAGIEGARMTVRGVGALTAADVGASEYAEMRRVAVRVRGVAPCAGAAEEVVGP